MLRKGDALLSAQLPASHAHARCRYVGDVSDDDLRVYDAVCGTFHCAIGSALCALFGGELVRGIVVARTAVPLLLSLRWRWFWLLLVAHAVSVPVASL